MKVIGVDPGQSGGFGVMEWTVSDTKRTGPIQARAYKMPDTERDVYELIHGLYPDFCIIEAVHSMPKQGVASSFKFGKSYGFLRGCLIGIGIPFEEVTPQKWQTTLGCRSGGDKNVTKSFAQQKFPSLKITHATADALLIAFYGISRANLHFHK